MAISFVDRLNGWLFGDVFYQGDSREIIARTTDGGRNWTRESVGIADIFGDAMMLDEHHGWGVTLSGEVLAYSPTTGVITSLPDLPEGFILRQNYPDPFNNSTVIEYEIPQASTVHLAIYDNSGRLIGTLVNEHQSSGVYRVQFDAQGLSSGTYFYTLIADRFQTTKQLILIK